MAARRLAGAGNCCADWDSLGAEFQKWKKSAKVGLLASDYI
jgi:hypothetical protein